MPSLSRRVKKETNKIFIIIKNNKKKKWKINKKNRSKMKHKLNRVITEILKAELFLAYE